MLQVADEISGENMEADEVLRATLNTLYAIEKKLKPYKQIKAAYELFAANVSGLIPNLYECPYCKKSDFGADGDLYLDVMNGTVICKKCLLAKKAGLPLPETDSFDTRNIILPLDSSALDAMRYVASAPPQRLFAFGLGNARSLDLFARAAETYLLNHLERDFDTLRFYNSIKEEN